MEILRASEPVWNIGFGHDERFARDSHHAFIRATTGGRRQIESGIGYVSADHGEITIVEFPNIRAALTAYTLASVLVRIWPEALQEFHAVPLTIVRCPVKSGCIYFPNVASDKSQQVICSRVARILREEREKRRLSMNTVAERAGLSQQMVSYVEREMRNPTLETLLRIAAAIEVNLAEVLGQAIRQTRKVALKSKS